MSMTVKEWKEMDGLYERVHKAEQELAKAWTVDELLQMLDCLENGLSDRQNADLFSQGVAEGYLRACRNIKFIVTTRKEN